MIVDDAIAFGLRSRNRVELVDDWMMQKLIRDFQGPVAAGGAGRVGLLKAGSRLDDQLRMARSVMALAARHMLASSESDRADAVPVRVRATCRSSNGFEHVRLNRLGH